MKLKLNPTLEDKLNPSTIVTLSDLEIDEDYVSEWDFRYRLVFKKRGKACFKVNKKKKRVHSNLIKHTVKNAPRTSFKKVRKRF